MRPKSGKTRADYSRKWRDLNPLFCKRDAFERNIKCLYDLSVEEYAWLVYNSKGLCSICGKPETVLSRNRDWVKELSVDHCHETGKIRGLLCHSCNTGLGSFKDSVALMKAAITYLESKE